MYFNNEKKNSFGSFSQAGKISAKQFQMIVNKDKILNNNKKNNKLILNNFLKRNGYNNIFLEENNFRNRIKKIKTKKIKQKKKFFSFS